MFPPPPQVRTRKKNQRAEAALGLCIGVEPEPFFPAPAFLSEPAPTSEFFKVPYQQNA